MENNNFLNKFKGQIERIGKEGIIGIMKSAHFEINKKNKKHTKKKGVLIIKAKSSLQNWNDNYVDNNKKKKSDNILKDNIKINEYNGKVYKINKAHLNMNTNKIINIQKNNILKCIPKRETNSFKNLINSRALPSLFLSKSNNSILLKNKSNSVDKQKNIIIPNEGNNFQIIKSKIGNYNKRIKTEENIIFNKNIKSQKINNNSTIINRYFNTSTTLANLLNISTTSQIKAIKSEAEYINNIKKQNNEFIYNTYINNSNNNNNNYNKNSYNNNNYNSNYYSDPKKLPPSQENLYYKQKSKNIKKENILMTSRKIEDKGNSRPNFSHLNVINEEKEEGNNYNHLKRNLSESKYRFAQLMNQRFMFQNLLPNSSKFKLKSIC